MSQDHVLTIDDMPPWDVRARAIYTELCEARDAAQARQWKDRLEKLEQKLHEREKAAEAASAREARLQHQLEKSHTQATENMNWRQEVEKLRAQLENAQEATAEPIFATQNVSTEYVYPRGNALKQLQAENAVLKAKVWLENLAVLPVLPVYRPTTTIPESESVWKCAKEMAAAPRVVDLSSKFPLSVQYAQFQQERERLDKWVAHWEACCS